MDSDKIVIDDSFEVITINDETTVEDMQNSNDNIEYIQPDYRLYLCEKNYLMIRVRRVMLIK